jgi:hypothetical protein
MIICSNLILFSNIFFNRIYIIKQSLVILQGFTFARELIIDLWLDSGLVLFLTLASHFMMSCVLSNNYRVSTSSCGDKINKKHIKGN